MNVIATILMVDLDPSYQSSDAKRVCSGDRSRVRMASQVQAPLHSPYKSLAVEMPQPLGGSELDALLEQNVYVVPSEAQRPRMVSQTIIRNVRVLGVGDFPRPDMEPTAVPTAVATAVPGAQPTELHLRDCA